MVDVNNLIEVSLGNKEYSRTIYWYIGNKCNYRCSYCDPVYHNGKFTWHDSATVINFLNALDSPTRVIFTGGEPSFHPDLLNIFTQVKKEHRLELISNGSKPLSFWKKLSQTRKNIRLNFSFHFESSKSDEFYQKVIFLTNKYQLKVSTLILLDPGKHWEDCQDLFYKFNTANIPSSPKLLLEPDNSPTFTVNPAINNKYSLDQLNWHKSVSSESQSKEIQLTDAQSSYMYVNSQYLIANQLIDFSGWECYAPSELLIISYSGDVTTSICAQQQKLGNIFSQVNFASNKSIKCHTNICRCLLDLRVTKKRVIPITPL